MSNVRNAAFSLQKYEFTDVLIDGKNQPSGNSLSINISANGVFDENKGNYELSFTTNVYERGNNENYIMVKCKAFYSFEGSLSFDDIPDYFYGNSIAILFPYVRSYISIITTQSNQKGVIIPTLNLTNLAEELKNSTVIRNAGNQDIPNNR
ncbi:MAG: hypothetical protein MJZ28_08230 [Paludibacteraceae bacterium]|nr:hypothetical protein [Paludibacteraceae bacterium]